jgi:hypothetical protein
MWQVYTRPTSASDFFNRHKAIIAVSVEYCLKSWKAVSGRHLELIRNLNFEFFIHGTYCINFLMSLNCSVGASVISCAIDGLSGLSEMSFPIDFWLLNTIPLEFWPKNPRWRRYKGGSKIHFFYLKNSKSEIFQKNLPRFVVLNSTKFL